MQAVASLSARRAVPGSAVIALGIGLALYQLSSLVLGPATSRELQVSLILPNVDLQEIAEPALPNLDLVIASRLQPGVAAIMAPMASSRRLASSHASSAQPAATTVAAPTRPAPGAAPAGPPLPVVIRGESEKSHYHDGGERGLRLARRR